MIRWILIAIGLNCFLLSAQVGDLNFVNYSNHNGLTSSQVYNIYQDSNGYIWFASDRGIARFNGEKFISYTQEDGVTGNTVFRFFPQPDGKVWCSTFSNKWFYFHPDDYVFHSATINDSIVKHSEAGLPTSFAQDSNGIIYIGFNYKHGPLVLDTNGRRIGPRVKTPPHTTSGKIYQEVDKNGRRITYTQYDAYENVTPVLKRGKRVFQHFESLGVNLNRTARNGEVFLFSSSCQLAVQNEKGETWKQQFAKAIKGIGFLGNAYIWVGLQDKGVKIYSLTGEEIAHYLDGLSVSFVMQDTHGGIWASTLSQGVFYAHPSQIQCYNKIKGHISSIDQGANQSPIITLMDNTVYVCNKGKLHRIPKNLGKHVFYDQTSNTYKSEKDLELRHTLQNSRTPRIRRIINQPDKPLLILSWDYLSIKHKHALKHFRIIEHVKSACWKADSIYLGTLNGLYVLDATTGEYRPTQYDALKVRIDDIKKINDTYFFATKGYGIYYLKQGILKQVSQTMGLSGDIVNRVFPENDWVVWAATNNGLSRITFKEDSDKPEILIINRSHGLPDDDVNDVYIQDSMIWAGTRSGLCAINKNTLQLPQKQQSLYLKWTTPQKAQGEATTKSNIPFSSNDTGFTFTYETCFFGLKEHLHFRYRLNGSENNWQYTSKKSVHFQELPPGNYTLEVQARVDHQNWTENKIQTAFKVHSPFYQTGWFRILLLALITTGLYFFVKVKMLTRNRDLVREFLRLTLKKIQPRTNSFIIHEQGKKHRVLSDSILYVKGSGNYIEIHTPEKRLVVRSKMGDFLELVPDRLEYIRIHRSYIVRVDKINGKNTKSLFIGSTELPIGKTYQATLSKLEL